MDGPGGHGVGGPSSLAIALRIEAATGDTYWRRQRGGRIAWSDGLCRRGRACRIGPHPARLPRRHQRRLPGTRGPAELRIRGEDRGSPTFKQGEFPSRGHLYITRRPGSNSDTRPVLGVPITRHRPPGRSKRPREYRSAAPLTVRSSTSIDPVHSHGSTCSLTLAARGTVRRRLSPYRLLVRTEHGLDDGPRPVVIPRPQVGIRPLVLISKWLGE